MAENNTAAEKTEPPTPRKREEARREGNVPKSTDLNAACALLAATVLIYLLGQRVFGGLKVSLEVLLSGSHASNPTRPEDLGALGSFVLHILASAVLPLMIAIGAIVLMVAVGQVGFLVTVKPITPKLSKLSPMRGIKNLTNARAAMRFVMSLGKLIAIAAVAMFLIYNDLPKILILPELSAGQAFAAATQMTFLLSIKLAVLLIILAILDFSFQRFQHERELRMSKQEVKEEMKRMEGDPLMKQRRSRVARQLAMQRTAQQVPQADVIVTNPTHLAIALKYDAESMRAPKVVAKGADFLAMRIRQIGSLHGIPIIERKPLARALYSSVDVGQEVPPEHYTAVAEIMAYVYRLSGRKSA
ncbi:flagellar biosynthesis protein FlhB [Phycisphaerales bacterium AB-hyl4]|uniref:Flagellar biosynthetic protein FlhB n=1 Tax=Natronomicrosphaera hydrolytica TaxID=3242702 RepID=A0ABV4U762_9BACT